MARKGPVHLVLVNANRWQAFTVCGILRNDKIQYASPAAGAECITCPDCKK